MRSASVPSARQTLANRILLGILSGSLLLSFTQFTPTIDDQGLRSLRNTGATLLLWLLLLGLSIAIGRTLLRRWAPRSLGYGESYLYGLAIGIGTIAYLVFGLGVVAALSTPMILVALVVLSVIFAPALSEIAADARRAPRQALNSWRDSPGLAKSVVLLACIALVLASLLALSPPWDYDGLMYHLSGPQTFLQDGRISAQFDNWYANGPFSLEMLFLVGLSFGLDSTAKLVHLTMGFLFVAATYLIARRWVGLLEAWLAVAIVMGIPLVVILASFAYIDLGWSAFEVLAVAALLNWWRLREHPWLILSGVMMGFALGSKYLGLIGFGVLLVAILVLSARDGPRSVLKNLFGFAIPALLVGLPWYLKNLVLLGNPTFPFVLQASESGMPRLWHYMAFLKSFGTGGSLLDTLGLPVNVYLLHEQFGAVMNRIDIPSLLFPIAALYAFLKKSPVVTFLIVLAFARAIGWAFGSQQIRFLFPAYAAIAIAAAYSIVQVSRDQRLRPSFRMFLPAVTVGLMLIPIFYQIRILLDTGTLVSISGNESRREFLARNISGFEEYSALEEASDGRVLLVGDGRGYYCQPICLPDPDHFRWSLAIGAQSSCAELTTWLQGLKAKYILLNWEDLDFLSQHDPHKVIADSLSNLSGLEQQGCLEVAIDTDDVLAYRISDPQNKSSAP